MQSSQTSGSGSGQRSQSGRAPGSFSPLTSSTTSPNKMSHPPPPRPSSITRRAPPPLQIETSINGDNSGPLSATIKTPTISVIKRSQRAGSPATPIYNQYSSNNSAVSLQNFSRPSGSPRIPTQGSSSPLVKGETRKHTATQGMFEPTLPSTATSNLSQIGMSQPHSAALTASQIAAQAAVMSAHKNAGTHARQRSQTVPFPGDAGDSSRRSSASKASSNHHHPSLQSSETAPSSAGFTSSNGYQMDRLGNANSAVATTAANVVFPRSAQGSPRDPGHVPHSPLPLPPPIPVSMLEKPLSKSEKAKAKLFSRPVKMGAKSEAKEKGLPSPGKIGSALSALQRANFSTSSLVDSSSQSLYSLNNSSSATIRPIDTTAAVEEKGKEKKHHFLSRQKQKLKDEYHLSSAASNSRPSDPSAPSSLYNFHLPSLASSSTSGFSKSKKEKKFERSESRLDNESTFNLAGDWGGSSAFPSLSQTSTYDSADHGRVGLGLHGPSSLEEAWPYLKKLLLVVFEGEDLRMPIEDINRVVQLHIQYCVQRRSAGIMLDDLRELLVTGFSLLDQTLPSAPEDRFLPNLVELWLFTFTSILPYLQAVFLPLDLEVSGNGSVLSADQAREFWANSNRGAASIPVIPDVRLMVLKCFRDLIILPRYDTLKTIFSRLSLEFLPPSLSNAPTDMALSTSPPESFPLMPPMVRPGTAMSLDPSVASYNSNSSTLLGDGSAGGRSRAVSNVSHGSYASDGAHRPYTPSGAHALSNSRQQNVEGSKAVTELVGRMLQCMSVLGSLRATTDIDDDGNKKIAELCRLLKLNWLGRGRTGRNRRGIVGGRVRRGDNNTTEEVRVA